MSSQAAREPTVVTSRRALGLVLVAGAAVQALVVATAWRESPLARTPQGDGALYWSHAARIASGEWVAEQPFVSAPLYSYFLGALRACGATLASVYAAQAVLHLATAACLAACARRAVGAKLAPLAALAYLLLRDPADAVARPAHSVLQAATVTWVLWESLRWRAPARLAACIRIGAALGIATLANPSALLLCFAVPVVLAAQEAATRARVRTVLLVALAAAPLVAAATLHNLLACGEWIPVAAHGGVTFAHGNQPGATGTYVAVEGVSADGARQALDARATVRAALRREPSWSEIDAHFRGIGLAHWRERPVEALGAVGRKLLHAVGSSRYGDVYVPELERESGLIASGALAPLPAPWIVLPGVAGLALLALRSRRHHAALLLGLLPLVVVAAFFYSPRYRFPALPPLTLGALAWAQWTLARGAGAWRLARALPFAIALAIGPVRDGLRLDELEPLRPAFEATLGSAWLEEGELARAERCLRSALAAGEEGARGHLAEILRRRGDLDAAMALLSMPPARWEPYARRTRVLLLAQDGRADEALRELASLEADYGELPCVREARGELGSRLATEPEPGPARAESASGAADETDSAAIRPSPVERPAD